MRLSIKNINTVAKNQSIYYGTWISATAPSGLRVKTRIDQSKFILACCIVLVRK